MHILNCCDSEELSDIGQKNNIGLNFDATLLMRPFAMGSNF